MEPPGLRSSPSSVTMRRECLYFLPKAIAWSIVSANTKRPSRYSINPSNFDSFSTNSDTLPMTPGSERTSSLIRPPEADTVVSGKKVARPKRFFFKNWIISLAVDSSSVTIFWMLPPSAVSTAVSYFLSTWMMSATTPTIPEFRSFCSITRRMLCP